MMMYLLECIQDIPCGSVLLTLVLMQFLPEDNENNSSDTVYLLLFMIWAMDFSFNKLVKSSQNLF